MPPWHHFPARSAKPGQPWQEGLLGGVQHPLLHHHAAPPIESFGDMPARSPAERLVPPAAALAALRAAAAAAGGAPATPSSLLGLIASYNPSCRLRPSALQDYDEEGMVREGSLACGPQGLAHALAAALSVEALFGAPGAPTLPTLHPPPWPPPPVAPSSSSTRPSPRRSPPTTWTVSWRTSSWPPAMARGRERGPTRPLAT